MVRIHPSDVNRVFTLDEARETVAIIYKITTATSERTRALMSQLDVLPQSETQLRSELEGRINHEVDQWQEKVIKLGGKPKGVWLADFDNGYGYYCWKFPEMGINFWHSYQDGFSGRKRIVAVEESQKPTDYESCTSTDQSVSR